MDDRKTRVNSHRNIERKLAHSLNMLDCEKKKNYDLNQLTTFMRKNLKNMDELNH